MVGTDQKNANYMSNYVEVYYLKCNCNIEIHTNVTTTYMTNMTFAIFALQVNMRRSNVFLEAYCNVIN